MPKNDDADTPISIRVPKELRQQIKNYAEANKLYRAGSANLSGALILIAREFFSGNVAQSSVVTDSDNVAQSNIDIESMINEALNSKIKELREEFEDHERIYQAQCQKGFELQIATFREEMNEAIATAKKPLLSVMREKVLAA
jgi:hypothetical protein